MVISPPPPQLLLCTRRLLVVDCVRLLLGLKSLRPDVCREGPDRGVGLLPDRVRLARLDSASTARLTRLCRLRSTHLYNNLTVMYPHAQIWLTGHSLGGALAALLGVTFGVPTVAFESPGDVMAARRLHLPLPPAMGGETVTHVYHTAGAVPTPPLALTHCTLCFPTDPIPNGVCTGKLSSCYAAGFAMESKCHLGQTILYDTVNKLGWSVDIRTHSCVSCAPPVVYRCDVDFKRPFRVRPPQDRAGDQPHPRRRLGRWRRPREGRPAADDRARPQSVGHRSDRRALGAASAAGDDPPDRQRQRPVSAQARARDRLCRLLQVCVSFGPPRSLQMLR
jgi:hypothetical protein